MLSCFCFVCLAVKLDSWQLKPISEGMPPPPFGLWSGVSL
jgi:hypothetical protein